MSVVAVAVVGGAVVGAYASNKAAKSSSSAVRAGASTAAEAQVYSTDRQIEEIQRQFDTQQQLLAPLVQNQYATNQAFLDLMGVSGGFQGAPETPEGTDWDAQDRLASQVNSDEIAVYQNAMNADRQRLNDLRQQRSYTRGGRTVQGQSPQVRAEIAQLEENIQQYTDEIAAVQARPLPSQRAVQEQAARGPQATAPGSTQFNRDASGAFVDRNLNQTSLENESQLLDQVRSTQLAGPTAEEDGYVNYIQENQLSGGNPEDDLRFQRAKDVTMTGARGNVLNAEGNLVDDEYYQDVQGRSLADGAAGQSVVGEEFNTSPGYSFAVEEMQRELDRKNSAGGNYGGRAIMEAQRRAQGLANQEYYNWADRRNAEVSRQAQAEAVDASRLDTAGQNFLARRATDIQRGDNFAAVDIQRGDQALDAAVRHEQQMTVMDQARGDDAYQNYLQRRAGDVQRLDSAVANRDQLRAVDLQRQDQAYYNYLSNLAGAAGFGNPTGQAVQASQTAGGQVAAAYGQQGSNLASIYQNAGNSQAQISQNQWANTNNAIQSGIGNWITYQTATA